MERELAGKVTEDQMHKLQVKDAEVEIKGLIAAAAAAVGEPSKKRRKVEDSSE